MTVCKHGQLARSCEICEAQGQIAELEAERDAAVRFIGVIGEELILRGYPGGDRDVILANIRMIPQMDALRERTEECAKVCEAQVSETRFETLAGRSRVHLDPANMMARKCAAAIRSLENT